MDKKISVLYTAFSILFLTALLGVGAGKLVVMRNGHISSAQTHFTSAQRMIAASYETEMRFDTFSFRDNIHSLFLSRQNFEVLLIYSYDTGLEYLFSRDSSGLDRPVIPAREPQPVPRFRYNRLTQVKLNRPLRLPDRTGMVMEGVYTVLSKRDIFPLLRDTLFILSAFLLLTGIFLSLLAFLRNRERAEDSEPHEGTEGPPPMHGPEEEPLLRDRLEYELERAVSSGRDLVLCLVSCTGEPPQEVLALLGRELAEHVGASGLTFGYGANAFASILPDIPLDQGIAAAEEFLVHASELQKSFPEDARCGLYAGLSARNDRVIDGERLLREADRALRKASLGKPGGIVGFRPDPDKYRRVMAEERDRP